MCFFDNHSFTLDFDSAISMVQFFYHLNGTKVGESQSPLVSEVKFTISVSLLLYIITL